MTLHHFLIHDPATGRVAGCLSVSQVQDALIHPLPDGHTLLPTDRHHPRPDQIRIEDGKPVTLS